MDRSNKDTLYDFFQDPSRENFTKLLKWNTGEQNNVDFKREWIPEIKLAEILIGMANCGGGVVLFGIEEKEDGTVESIGINKMQDKADVNNKMKKFLPENLIYTVHDFDYSGEEYSKLKDKKFQVIAVESKEEELPYIWCKDSSGNEAGCVFIRRGTTTCKANNYELNALIEKRIRASYTEGSSLELGEHIKQLKVLYNSIDKNKSYLPIMNNLTGIFKPFMSSSLTIEPNSNYPEEGYDEFIRRMIDRKKLKIEKVLDLK